ncbi:serpin I2-like isoform X2 [Trichogramma pretiosum]|uniref:serpin I2-like isoform X2 n=1 Tax=Trichogramma pretiosum TaxID=7493 RepID=UPI000C719DED|nr:serpin I2-like isoform X2 [Trichogramma pretiosum]XP_023313639.1 serpin I2-like isoform X2 [Trichogramma pretiosum]
MSIDVPTMKAKVRIDLTYAKTHNAELVNIPYNVNGFSMLIIMPYKASELSIVENELDKIISNFTKREGATYLLLLPKFKIDQKLDLEISLKELGLYNLFLEKADLSGITCEKSVVLNSIFQNCFVNIVEAGSEPSSTVFSNLNSETSHYVNPPEFHVNKPFIFMIMYYDISVIVGKVINPLN